MPSSSLESAEKPSSQLKLESLRNALIARNLSGFIVPKGDEFQNESVPPHADRLAFLTGFTGSAGTAVILRETAVLFVDSRYTLQARTEVNPSLYNVELWPKVAAHTWLAEHVKPGEVIGYDPRLHTMNGFKLFRLAAEKHGFSLHACEENPIDGLWADRPAAKFAPIFAHDLAYAGESAASKLERVREAIVKNGAAGLFISAPDSVAWLFNIRGRDVAHTPLPLVRAYVPITGKPVLFVQHGHITAQNGAMLQDLADIESIVNLDAALPDKIEKSMKVLVDPGSITLQIADILQKSGATVIEGQDPCVLFKAKKNSVECEGARAAQKRDGVALCRFLAWLDVNAAGGELDEIGAAEKLSSFRREMKLFDGESFETISGAGANGAIVHYRVTPSTNRKLSPNSLYLIDSGGQYHDGTTDVTRTVVIGKPTPQMRRHFTLVLKGHIAIATARFPAGTRGVDLDAFARRALWNAGLDYGHGTGHGIGSYLSVHEGPQSLSRNGMAVLEPGMIVSNEPGFYREGHYGIRIENLLLVSEPEAIAGGEMPMIAFETLTLAPIDHKLIDMALLSLEKLAWLNAYHARVYAEIAPSLNDEEKAWLLRATAPLA